MSDGRDPGDESLGSISQGAGLFLVGRILSRVISFFTNVILTRTLGTNLYGIYAYFNVIITLAGVVTKFGSDRAILRFLPEYDGPARQAVLTLAYGTSLATSVFVAALVYLFAPTVSRLTVSDPLFTSVLRVGALVVPFYTLSTVTLSAFRATERMDYHAGISGVVRPAFRLVFVGGAVLLGYSVVGATAGLVVSGVLTLAFGLAVLHRRTELFGVRRPTVTEARRYYDFSTPLFFSQIGNFVYNRVDVLMVGVLLASSAIGIYNVSMLVSRVLPLPLLALNQLFAPIASELYHDGRTEELETVYASTTRWAFTASLVPTAATVLYAEELLAVFGPEFVDGVLVLVSLSLAQLTNCVAGPSGTLLMMTDHQYLSFGNQFLSGVANAVLNYVLILQFGLVGAAVATATVLVAVNAARVVEVWYLEGLLPYDATFLKPATAGVASVAVLYAASLFLQRYALLVGGGVLGGGTFVLVLYVLGIEKRDRRLLERALR